VGHLIRRGSSPFLRCPLQFGGLARSLLRFSPQDPVGIVKTRVAIINVDVPPPAVLLSPYLSFHTRTPSTDSPLRIWRKVNEQDLNVITCGGVFFFFSGFSRLSRSFLTSQFSKYLLGSREVIWMMLSWTPEARVPAFPVFLLFFFFPAIPLCRGADFFPAIPSMVHSPRVTSAFCSRVGALIFFAFNDLRIFSSYSHAPSLVTSGGRF